MINGLSIIYPIFNEEKRLKFIFSDIELFNKYSSLIKKEFIFVDDGSVDSSKLILKKFINKNSRKNILYKIISYKKNKGKGFALKKGVLNASKEWILTTDADASVSNLQLIDWIAKNYITKNIKIYNGTRNHFLSKLD